MIIFRTFVGCLCFLLWLPASQAANERIFSEFYERIGGERNAKEQSQLDAVTAARLSGMLGVNPEQIIDYIHRGIIKSEAGDLAKTCAPAQQKTDAEGNPQNTLYTTNDCMQHIRDMWEREYEIVEIEFLATQQSAGFSRWWDGNLSGRDDFDVLGDLNVLDRQFNGADALMVEAPKPDIAKREELSLAEYDYRLQGGFPSAGLPFQAGTGCDAGTVSLYGGLICLPKFCTDFMCIDIVAVPGRRDTNVSSGKTESSVANIVNDLRALAIQLDNAEQITPTRNTNQAHWFSQLFNWDQIWNANFTAAPRPIPIFDGIIPPDGSEQKKQTYKYGYNSESGQFFLDDSNAENSLNYANALADFHIPQASEEMQAQVDSVWEEYKKVRDEFGLCNADPECTSFELLAAFVRNCELYGARSTRGNMESTLDSCVVDFARKADNNPFESWDSYFVKSVEIKQEFDEEMSKSTTAASKQIEAFLITMKGISECAIQQAQYTCGMPKLNCAREGKGIVSE